MTVLSKVDVLKKISESSYFGNLGLFIGAGFSKAIMNETENIALSWPELLDKCLKELKLNIEEKDKIGLSYPECATLICQKYSEDNGLSFGDSLIKLKNIIAEITNWYPNSIVRDEYGKYLTSIDPNWIITTNYDLIIESLLTGKCLTLGPEEQLVIPKGMIPIYHLHGIRTNPNSLIISQEDYISLFRPNEYRQTKLSLILKESTTLIIGYGLRDMNVLSAVDWSNNVYSGSCNNYPQDIIQVLRVDGTPKVHPYVDKNKVIILEINDLRNFLLELSEVNNDFINAEKVKKKDFAKINKFLEDTTGDSVNKFIVNSVFRISLLKVLSSHEKNIVSGCLFLFSKSIEEVWARSSKAGAFEEYNQLLIIILDFLENLEIDKIPPAIKELIISNLDRLIPFIGNKFGESYSALNTWESRRHKLLPKTISELKSMSNSLGYNNVKRFIKAL